ncbi:MAG: hypothetical protein GX159_09940 [Flavobacteriaceae bacterium]|jgi:hypothetical protein|nr:hypothetical protein [Flavobacteriaceae bacterium]
MKEFYKKLCQKFDASNSETQARFQEFGLTAPRYIDLYAQQDLNEENFELFHGNALLVEWMINYEESPAIATIELRVCFEQLRSTANISANMDVALKSMDYNHLVDQLVQTITTESTGKLKLVWEGSNRLDSIVDIYIFRYECQYVKRAPEPEYPNTGKFEDLEINGQLVEKINSVTEATEFEWDL